MRNIRKVIDASILMGFLNVDDKFHGLCSNFFQKVSADNQTALILPMHTVIEINTKLRKLKKNGKWTSNQNFIAEGPEYYEITAKFINQIQEKKLYDLFLHKLGSQDAIYAAIAFIEKVPLVTIDKDFEKVQDFIQVEFLS